METMVVRVASWIMLFHMSRTTEALIQKPLTLMRLKMINAGNPWLDTVTQG